MQHLKWSAACEPNSEIGYTHVVAETPFGRIVITWKSWKDCPNFSVDEHPVLMCSISGNSLDDIKLRAEEKFFTAIDSVIQSAAPIAWRMVTPESTNVIFLDKESEAHRFALMDNRLIQPVYTCSGPINTLKPIGDTQ